ncbi:hypothetical protein QE152_g27054 [Popillia japonica]|uniref:Uncharacterized protein n=1 Tax=Popillia japonica TaxID=7064 RepID=A0AAW1JWJ8_POPJA
MCLINNYNNSRNGRIFFSRRRRGDPIARPRQVRVLPCEKKRKHHQSAYRNYTIMENVGRFMLIHARKPPQVIYDLWQTTETREEQQMKLAYTQPQPHGVEIAWVPSVRKRTNLPDPIDSDRWHHHGDCILDGTDGKKPTLSRFLTFPAQF